MTALALATGTAVLLSSLSGPRRTTLDVVEVGDKPTYQFHEAPTNSLGIKSLDELKGKPVLVEFWGTR